jgi:hypothetical protein
MYSVMPLYSAVLGHVKFYVQSREKLSHIRDESSVDVLSGK